MIEITVIGVIVAAAFTYTYRKLRRQVGPDNRCGCDHAESCDLVEFIQKEGRNVDNVKCSTGRVKGNLSN
ncbi:MAG TPA: hypothetical protein VJ417_04675 [Candidatus Glassbacteria bacterium]|nr:hypothetical protein [Candidatus Glassbacteria bacterium]